MAEYSNSKSKQFKGLKTWGLVIAVLTIIPVAYGYFYFQDRSSYLTNHYFRSLSGIEKQINQGLKGMDFLLGFAVVEENVNLKQDFKDNFCDKKDKSKPNYCREYKEYLKKYSAIFHNIKFSMQSQACIFAQQGGALADKKNDKTCFSISGRFDNKKITVFDEKKILGDELKLGLRAKEVAQEAEAFNSKDEATRNLVNKKFKKIVKQKKNELKKAREVIVKTKPKKSGNKQSKKNNQKITHADVIKLVEKDRKVLSVTVPIKDLIDPLPALQYFNRILLLNKGGDIIYRSGSDDLSRTSNISAFDDFIRFENLSEYLSSGVNKELEISGKGFNYKDVDQVTSHSRVRKATIAGISYLLYIQPFHAVRQQNDGQVDDKAGASNSAKHNVNPEQLAYIIGIIPEEKNNKAIMALPLGRTNMLFFAILIILLLTPHLKLLFSGPQFMPNRAFVFWLTASFPLLTIVLVLGALSAYDYFQLKQSLDNTAMEIGEKISRNFSKEFTQFNKVLRPEFYTQHEIYHDLQAKPNRFYGQSLPMFIDKQADDLKELMLAQPTHEKIRRYPKFELAFYLNSEGMQAGKQVTYRSFPVIDIDVHRRQYFNQVYFHPERLPLWSKSMKYYSERIETYDHGIKLTALSFPVSLNKGDRDKPNMDNSHQPRVLAILKLMHTFFHPVLPAGFGFAVIKDLSGEVIYHSNDQRSLLENFYIETDENQQIIAAAQMRHKHLVSGKYYGHAHNFWVTPLDNTPWSLIVFYDTELMELANIKTSIFSVGFAFMMVLLLMLFLAFCYCIKKSLLQTLLKNVPNGVFWRRINKYYGLSSSRFIKVYALSNTFSLLFIFGVIALIWFISMHNNQVKKIVKFNLLHIGTRLIDRNGALLTEIGRVTEFKQKKSTETRYLNESLFNFANYAQVDLEAIKQSAGQGSEGPTCLSKEVGANAWFVYYTPPETPPCDNTQKEMKDTEFPDEYVPIINYLDSRHQLLSHGHSTDNSWHFYENSTAHISAVFNMGSGSEFNLTSAGYYTQTQDVELPMWWYFYLFMILPLLCYFLIKLTSVRLFGLGFDQQIELQGCFSKYAQRHSLLISNKNNYEDISRQNFLTIAHDKTGQFMELKVILYNLSHNHMINFTNTIALMQLIDSGILQQHKGMIKYHDPDLQQWVCHQPWSHISKEYQVQDSTNLWAILAMPFYSIILLAFVFLVLSGGQVGELMLAMIPIVLTGGIPFVSSFIGKRFSME